MTSPNLPAHETKHVPVLEYVFRPSNRTFLLNQVTDGRTNGTALWLGAQCLSYYLADVGRRLGNVNASANKTAPVPASARPRAIELGAGIGLTRCVNII